MEIQTKLVPSSAATELVHQNLTTRGGSLCRGGEGWKGSYSAHVQRSPRGWRLHAFVAGGTTGMPIGRELDSIEISWGEAHLACRECN